jgi:hypothetical protein
MALALPYRPARISITPTYDSTETGPRYALAIDLSTREDTRLEELDDPFFGRTIALGRRELLTALLAGELRLTVQLLGDEAIVEDVRELDAAYLGPDRTREIAAEVEAANTTTPDLPAIPAAPKLPTRVDQAVRDAAKVYDEREGQPWTVAGLLDAITAALGALVLTPDEMASRLHAAADAAARIDVGGGEPLTDALWDAIETDGQMPDPRAVAALAYRTIAAEIEAGRL